MAESSNLKISLNAGVRTIRIDCPRKKNPVGPLEYAHITELLIEDAQDENVVLTILTGTGEYFCSGNDLGYGVQKMATMSFEDISSELSRIFRKFIETVSTYPKLLIGVINGPAIGIGVTLMGLCDVVYASDRATFRTPFVPLGLCIEGCASYLLPRIMGRSKAAEMLLLAETLSADDALRFNLIAKIVPHQELPAFIEKLSSYGTKLPLESLMFNKKLILAGLSEQIVLTREREIQQLVWCQQSEFFLNNMMNFVNNKKSKL